MPPSQSKSTLEDLRKLLESGAPPSESLPLVRSLFSTLPSTPAATSSHQPAPIDRVFYALPDGTKTQLPYLRPSPSSVPPFHAFDRELSVNLISFFKPYFVAPPDASTLAELLNSTEPSMPSSPSQPGPTTDMSNASERAVELLNEFFSKERSVPAMPILDEEGWAMVLSKAIDSSVEMSKIERLIMGIHQKELARALLACILPWMCTQSEGGEVVETAVDRAQVGEMEVYYVRELLQLYRGLGGEVAERAQRAIVRGLTSGI